MKFVKVGMVHLLMRLFERWDRFDGQMRLKICNYALNTLQHLCAISKSNLTPFPLISGAYYDFSSSLLSAPCNLYVSYVCET